MAVFRLTFKYAHHGDSVLAGTIAADQPPAPHQWEIVTIGDEDYWRISTISGVLYARRTHVYSIAVEEIQEDCSDVPDAS